MTRAALALMVSLLLLPSTARTAGHWWELAPPPVVHGKIMPSRWWKAVKRSSERYHVNPFFVAAVAWIESDGWDCGRLGHSHYWGPMGINEHCPVPHRALADPVSNIRVGVKALRGHSPRQVLKRYNATWYKDHYVRDVLALKRQLERDGWMEVGIAAVVNDNAASQGAG